MSIKILPKFINNHLIKAEYASSDYFPFTQLGDKRRSSTLGISNSLQLDLKEIFL